MTTEPSPPAVESAAATTRYDGVICFGGVDWWYHNRGHYDLQMMRELSADLPVLYVNSIGMRVPRVGEGSMFLKRVTRKLKSFRRGLVRVRDRFAVLSPVVAPAGVGAQLNARFLASQVERAAKKLGIRRPLVWVACPPAEPALAHMKPAGVVYQRTDRFEAFHGVDPDRIRGFDRALKERADVTLYCSTYLFEEERAACKNAVFVDHGADTARFESAGRGNVPIPEDAGALPRPLIGFIGGIDAHTFDPAMFVETANKLASEAHFMLVGGCSLPDGWCDLANVSLLGRRPYDEVAAYMAACDVLIMPWNDSDWIMACNPVKLKEYLAVGRPIVSAPFAELDRYGGLVAVADDAESTAAAIRRSLAEPDQAVIDAGRDRVRDQTWTNKTAAARAAVDEALRRGE